MRIIEKLCHNLFGWHYIVIQYGCYDYLRKVDFTREGRPYVVVCGIYFFLDDMKGRRWECLTCSESDLLKH